MFGFFLVKMLEIPVNQAHLVCVEMCIRHLSKPS